MFFLQFVQIEYQNLDYKNYLVLRQSRNVQLIDYCCRMLEQNKITGLLPVYSKRLNNKIDFFYDISGKKRLGDYLQQHHCADEQGRQILLNIAETIKSLPQYFLKQQLCIMDLQYVFINDALQVFFPLLPLAEMLENRNDIQSFFRRIVSDYFVTEANNQFYDGLLKYLSRQDFDLNEFVKRLQPEKLENKSSANQVQPEIEPLPVVSEPENNKESKHGLHWPFAGKSGKKENNAKAAKVDKPKKQDKKQAKKAPKPVPPVSGFNIPGMENGEQSSVSEPAPEAKPQPRKKSLFGLGKKNKPESENQPKKKPAKQPEQVQQPPVVPTPLPARSYLVDEPDMETEILDFSVCDCYLYHDRNRVEIVKTPFSLGKQNVDYQINKGFISRLHALITLENGDYYIQDNNSRNHTFLNGEQLPPYTPYKLVNGSKIRLGSEELIFYNENGR